MFLDMGYGKGIEYNIIVLEHSPALQSVGGQGHDLFLLLLWFRFIEFSLSGVLSGALTFMSSTRRVCVYAGCVCVNCVCLPCSPLFDSLDLSTVAAPHSLRVSPR